VIAVATRLPQFEARSPAPRLGAWLCASVVVHAVLLSHFAPGSSRPASRALPPSPMLQATFAARQQGAADVRRHDRPPGIDRRTLPSPDVPAIDPAAHPAPAEVGIAARARPDVRSAADALRAQQRAGRAATAAAALGAALTALPPLADGNLTCTIDTGTSPACLDALATGTAAALTRVLALASEARRSGALPSPALLVTRSGVIRIIWHVD
jgi:hypothetical protein